MTSLIDAATCGSEAAARRLLDARADVEQRRAVRRHAHGLVLVRAEMGTRVFPRTGFVFPWLCAAPSFGAVCSL